MFFRLCVGILTVLLAAMNTGPVLADAQAGALHFQSHPILVVAPSQEDCATILTPDALSPLTVEPASGPVGTTVTVGGAGFKAGEPIIMTFDNVTVKADGAVSNGEGKFTASFDIPPSSGGRHVVEARNGNVSATGSFTVTPTASLDPASGYIGTHVSVSASGFLSNRPIQIVFGDTPPIKTVMSGNDGSVNATFPVPAQAAGTYKVIVTDGTNYKDLGFIINIDASMEPATTSSDPGYVGQRVTAQGAGFVPGKPLSVTFDNRQVAVGSVASDSRFSVTFIVPATKGGTHTVTLSDGVNSFPLPFFVETASPPAPLLLTPPSGGSQPAQATFSWSPVTDISGVTYTLQVSGNTRFSPVVLERSGITASGYTLTKPERLKPPEDGSPYYWRVKAVDGASNQSTWSDTWYFSVTTPSTPWVGYTLGGLAILIVTLAALWLVRRSRASPHKNE